MTAPHPLSQNSQLNVLILLNNTNSSELSVHESVKIDTLKPFGKSQTYRQLFEILSHRKGMIEVQQVQQPNIDLALFLMTVT